MTLNDVMTADERNVEGQAYLSEPSINICKQRLC